MKAVPRWRSLRRLDFFVTVNYAVYNVIQTRRSGAYRGREVLVEYSCAVGRTRSRVSGQCRPVRFSFAVGPRGRLTANYFSTNVVATSAGL